MVRRYRPVAYLIQAKNAALVRLCPSGLQGLHDHFTHRALFGRSDIFYITSKNLTPNAFRLVILSVIAPGSEGGI